RRGSLAAAAAQAFFGSESASAGVWRALSANRVNGCVMPYPLPQKSKISEGKGWPLERRPELASFIARVATLWSRVEERLGTMITELLGADPRLGMTMFRAVSATSD